MGFRARRTGVAMLTTVAAVGAYVFVACSSFDGEAPKDPPASEASTSDGPGADSSSDVLDGGGTDALASDADLGDDASTVLASGLTGLIGLAVSDTQEVFVARSNGEILAMPLLGGDGGTSLVSIVPGLKGIAVAGTNLFYTTSGPKLLRRTLGSSTNTTEKDLDVPILSLVPVDSATVFTLRQATAAAEVRRYEASFLNTGEGYMTTPGSDDLAIASPNLYWTDPTQGVVRAGTVTGGLPLTQIATEQVGCSGVAADVFGVYWLMPTAVRAKAPADKSPRTIANETATAIAAKGGTVYWLASGSPGRLRRGNLDGDAGAPRTLAAGFPIDFKPSQKAIALTPTYVVWITSDGRVMRHDR